MDKFKQIDPATSTIQASISSSSKRLLCFRKPAIVPPPRMPSLLGPVGGGGGGGDSASVQGSRVESEAIWAAKSFFNKNFIFY